MSRMGGAFNRSAFEVSINIGIACQTSRSMPSQKNRAGLHRNTIDGHIFKKTFEAL